MAVIAGLVAAGMLVGTAVAAPRLMGGTGFNGYGIMRSYGTSGTFIRPSLAEMNRFMNNYRTSDGSIDYNRMYEDVASGSVTPPCAEGASGIKGASNTQPGQSSQRRGSAMMKGWRTNGDAVGYGMMGSSY